MTKQEERHLHLEQCVSDLNEAWRLAGAIEEAEGHALAGAAFKYLLVAYSRPFKKSRGNLTKDLRLENDVVPSAFLGLHVRLLAARDQILAHSDFSPREPQLHVAPGKMRPLPIIVQNVVHGTEDLPNLGEIVSLIQGTLDNLYEMVRASELELPITIQP